MRAVAVLIDNELSPDTADAVLSMMAPMTGVQIVVLLAGGVPSISHQSSLAALGVEPPDLFSSEAVTEALDSSRLRQLEATAGRSAALLASPAHPALGVVVHGDVVAAVQREVEARDVSEVAVITAQNDIAEFFHIDWPSRLREALDIPVHNIPS